ncbi:MAG: putative S-layer protein [Candidatus Nanoarchaeia archaeon]|nr:putative S-layer protein [Candidatus Nanoarchaeia archaeon]
MNTKIVLGLVLALLMLIAGAAAQTLTITSITTASGDPGASVDVTVTVRNAGASNISSVILTSTALEYGINSITAPVIETITNLNAGTEQSRTFSLSLPSLPSGAYSGTITATDSSNANETASRAYSVAINPVSNFEIVQTKARITGQSDDSESTALTIRNTGSTTLTSFSLSYAGDFEDDDGDMVLVSFSSLASLTPGATAEVTVLADIERNVDIDTYTGTITASSNSITRTLPLEVEVEPKICKYGRQGYLSVAIDRPDSGDDFTPGETIDLKISIDNDYSKKLNVGAEAILYDATDSKVIARASFESEYIDDGDSETMDTSISIPSKGIDEDNEFYLYVKAFKATDEEDHCAYDRIEVEIEREDEMVVIDEFTITQTEFSCTDTVTATVTVENTGLEDQENVYIQLYSNALGIEINSKKFSVNAYDENGNRHTESFVFNAGNAEEGDYKLIAFVYYGNNEEDRKEMIVHVNPCDTDAMKLMGEARLLLSMEDEKLVLPYTATKFVLPLIVENKGGKAAAFKVDVTEISGWAEVTAIEAPSLLGPGEQYHVYVYMQLKDNVASGVHDFRINLRNDAGLIYSKLASVEVGEAPAEDEISGDAVVDVGSVSKWLFSDKQRLFWIAGDLVLVILALVFLKLLLKR